MLVAYTTAAKNASANINNLIELAVAEANQSYENSNVSVQMNLVNTYEVNYTESGHTYTDKIRFKGTTDGYMDEVHTLRNNCGADICILIISDADYAGEAYTIGASSSTAFCVVQYSYATGFYTFAHEIGHLQNCRHNICADPSGTYNHGYEYCSGNWRTIMAYNQSCCVNGTTRFQYWSNPDITYNGVSMGTAQDEDNARMLDYYSPTVEAFKSSFTSGALSTNQTWYYKELSGDITVPSGKTLTIPSSSTINLNGYSIISTGGTINFNHSATINGLRAQLAAGAVFRGLCGKIQTAADYAEEVNEIYVEDGNFNENVTIMNVDRLAMNGNSTGEHTQFNNLTINNCYDFELYANIGAKRVYINNTDIALLYSLSTIGTDNTLTGLTLYYSERVEINDLTAYFLYTAINSATSEAEIEFSSLSANNQGLRSTNASNIDIDHTLFCGTNLDLYAYNFSSIDATYCSYDNGGVPSIDEGGGSTINSYYNQNCSVSKISSNQQTENSDYVTLTNEDIPGSSEFSKINLSYFAVNKKFINDIKARTDIDKAAYSSEYEGIIKSYKEFIENNPDSPLTKVALITIARCYRRVDKLNSKRDAGLMKNFLTEIITNKEYSALIHSEYPYHRLYPR